MVPQRLEIVLLGDVNADVDRLAAVGRDKLEPSDVIAAGTPAGVGAARQPFPEGLLKVGDMVRIEIDRIGALENTVIEEPEGYLVAEDEESLAWAP